MYKVEWWKNKLCKSQWLWVCFAILLLVVCLRNFEFIAYFLDVKWIFQKGNSQLSGCFSSQRRNTKLHQWFLLPQPFPKKSDFWPCYRFFMNINLSNFACPGGKLHKFFWHTVKLNLITFKIVKNPDLVKNLPLTDFLLIKNLQNIKI